jgi:phosphatidylglycerophosphatase A
MSKTAMRGGPSMSKKLATLLMERGVYLHEIAQIVYDLQIGFVPDLTLEYCVEVLTGVLEKREVQFAVFTGQRAYSEGLTACL